MHCGFLHHRIEHWVFQVEHLQTESDFIECVGDGDDSVMVDVVVAQVQLQDMDAAEKQLH